MIINRDCSHSSQSEMWVFHGPMDHFVHLVGVSAGIMDKYYIEVVSDDRPCSQVPSSWSPPKGVSALFSHLKLY